MKPTVRSLALLALLYSVAGPTLADEPSQPGLLDRARQSTGEATEWAKEQTHKGWEATKKGVGEAADWTAGKTEKGVDATAEGVDKAADWTADKARKTKEKSLGLWERAKVFFTGDHDREDD